MSKPTTEIVSLSKLVPNTGQIEGLPKNPRKIDDASYSKLLNSLKEDPDFLNHKPLHVFPLADKYVVLGGNQRLKALKDLGYTEVPVTIYAADTPVDVLKARVIKDNSAYGEYDHELLMKDWSMEPLADWGLDFEIERPEPEDEVEEDTPPALGDGPAISILGKIYQLGEHLVMCGDATNADDVALLMGGGKADIFYTDPPYGVSYKSKKLGSIQNDELRGNDLYAFIRDSFDNALRQLNTGAAIYCWYEDKFRQIFQAAIEDAGFEFKQNLIWNKGMNLSGADYQKSHENCMYFQIKGDKAEWHGGRDKKTVLGLRRRELAEMKKEVLVEMLVNLQQEQTVWDYDKDNVTTYVHPTQKPVIMTANAIRNNSKPGATVLDLFAGSGSTLMACHQTNRVCRTMELDPKYIDVIRKRYHKFETGRDDGWEEATPALA